MVGILPHISSFNAEMTVVQGQAHLVFSRYGAKPGLAAAATKKRRRLIATSIVDQHNIGLLQLLGVFQTCLIENLKILRDNRDRMPSPSDYTSNITNGFAGCNRSNRTRSHAITSPA